MSMKVLIVDDSRVLRMAIRRAVSQIGFETETLEAGDGQEAYELLGEQSVDLVLLDLNMPVLDGEGLLRRLAKEERLAQMNVVLVTTETNRRRLSLLQCLDGVQGYLRKPFEPEQLRDLVAEKLGVVS